MKITVGGKEYTVHFTHLHYPKPMWIPGTNELMATDKTVCTMHIITPVAIGTAFCSVKDNFDKTKGREEAFKEMLKEGGFRRHERKEAWNQFWQQSRKRFHNRVHNTTSVMATSNNQTDADLTTL